MRVTHRVIADTATMYLMRDLDQLQRVQGRISTGRNYTLISEDPVATTQIVHFEGQIAETEQYRRAVDSGLVWNEMTSSVLTQVEELLMEILDVSEQLSHASATSGERAQGASTLNSLLEELVMAANRQFKGKYLFGGTETLTVPFTANTDAAGVFISGVSQNPDGIGGVWGHLVSEVDTVEINTPGDEVFQPSGAGAVNDVFQVVVRLRQALAAHDFSAMGLEEERLREAVLHVADINAGLGNRLNQLERIGESLDTIALDYDEYRSKLEDTDIAKALVEFNIAESVYQAALASTARILRLSLVNFM